MCGLEEEKAWKGVSSHHHEKDRQTPKVNFIREITYTTLLANVIMVKKPGGKWCMCVNYTNLKKACSK